MIKKCYLNGDITLRKEKFGGLAVKRGTVEAFLFNKVGYEILKRINDKMNTVEEIVNSLEEKYNVSLDILTRDTDDFIHFALESNIIEKEGK